ncbi:alpha/beta fold hydrolase [Candidatus Dependentiae bacterium]|nr:alpha/beta fold hydrolase [Candidatus Dependentiae bacterium]
MKRITFLASIALILLFFASQYFMVFSGPKNEPDAKEAVALDFLSFQKIVHHHQLREKTFIARDKTALFYRFIPSNHPTETLIIFLHGSSYHGRYLVPLGLKLHEHAHICIPDIRGHGKSGPHGTCSYIGQLEDDLADLITHISSTHPYKKIILVGHSSGGGLAIRFTAGKHKNLAHSTILLTPAIITAPTMKTPGARAWAKVNKIKLLELVACNAMGITRFNKSVVVTFNKPKKQCDGTEVLAYDYNLASSMHPRIPYKKDLTQAANKCIIFVGKNDEINNPWAFKELFPQEKIQLLENTGHLDIINNMNVIEEIKKQAMNTKSSFTEHYITTRMGHKLWTQVSSSGKTPILLIHGGPGGTSTMLKPVIDELIKNDFKVITYHQLDSAKSDAPNNPKFWTIKHFTRDLEDICQALKLNNFYIFGYSWGVVLAIEYALKHQEKLQGMILSNFTASSKSFEEYLQKLRSRLSPKAQKILLDCEANNQVGETEWQKIMANDFMKKHFCILQKWPNEFDSFMKELNWNVCMHFFGKNDFHITGTAKDWDRWKDLEKINTPTLVLGGRYDQCSPEDAKKMSQLLKQGAVYICSHASHLPFYEQPIAYFNALTSFLKNTQKDR